MALTRATNRELGWGLRKVSREVAHWRSFAANIPDDALRHDALEAIERKRANIDGAALFSTLPNARSSDLLRLLVAFEILADYLDCTSERGAHIGARNGLQLHRALIEALDPRLSISNYYRYHPWCEDGGYIHALVDTCRRICVRLPSYQIVQPELKRATHLAQVLALNHEQDSRRRDATLEAWARVNFPGEDALVWFEWTGGASAWLTILALLALAADSGRDAGEAEATYEAYLPWVSLTGTMLDSYGDTEADAVNRDHSYIAHYSNLETATKRVGEIIRRSLEETASLPNGGRHLVIVSCMIAMYLSKDSVRAPDMRARTVCLIHTAGLLTRLLVPVLRTWRILYHQRTEVDMNSLDVSLNNPRRRRASAVLPPRAPFPSLMQTLAFWRDPYAYLEWCRHRYGDTFTIQPVGRPPLVFMARRADIKTIVTAPAEALHPGAGAAVIAPLVGAGSFMLAEEDEHLAGRRGVLRAFHDRFANEHADMIRETAEREVATWPLETPVALHRHLRELTLRVILLTVFEREDGRLQELHAKLLAMLSVTGSLALQEPPLRQLPSWRGIWKTFLADRLEVDRIITSLIKHEAHVRARDNGTLAMLLGSTRLNDGNAGIKQIRDTLMSLILAGHETTAAELAWAFQLLAHHRPAMALLVDDLDKGADRHLTAVIHEVLRHRPVFLFTIPRAVQRPFEISATTYHPPTHLAGCVHLMHHDPDLYPEPHAFRPERFLDASPTPEIWMPWGGGRKRCPGHHLALLEMRAVLQTVLSRLEVRPARERIETARWRSVIVTPGDGCRVVLRQRSVRRGRDPMPLSDTRIAGS